MRTIAQLFAGNSGISRCRRDETKPKRTKQAKPYWLTVILNNSQKRRSELPQLGS